MASPILTLIFHGAKHEDLITIVEYEMIGNSFVDAAFLTTSDGPIDGVVLHSRCNDPQNHTRPGGSTP